MMEGIYGAVLKRHALTRLFKPTEMPKPQLGVGYGERLDPQAMKIEYQQNKKHIVIPSPGTSSIENATMDGSGNPVDPASFDTKSFWLGNPMGGL